MSNTLAMESLNEIFFLDAADFSGVITPEETMHILKICGAVWCHSGNSAQPHAKLTANKCGSGYVRIAHALKYPSICNLLGRMLVRKLEDEYDYYSKHSRTPIDWVIGSNPYSVSISYEVARGLGTTHGFTEKGNCGEHMWRTHHIEAGEHVLQVEAVATSSETFREIRNRIVAGNSTIPKFVPVTMAIVDCSQKSTFDGGPILSLAHLPVQHWQQKMCPLCAQGSERVDPKTNWDHLTGNSYFPSSTSR